MYEEFKKTNNKNDILISIEHCSNCHEHESHTNHINNIYPNFARGLQKAIQLRYPFIRIILKSIDTDIINSNIKENIISNKEVRIGAMEVQLYKAIDNTVVNLHSKLNSKKFPNLEKLLDKINKYTTMFDLNIKIGKITLDKNKNKESNNNELKGITINIYQMNNPTIFEISERLNEDLEILNNPKKD